MKFISLSAFYIFFLSLVTTPVCADNLKIKVIDMQQVLQKAPQIAVINEQLTKQFKPRQEKIVSEQKALQTDVTKLNKDSTVMSSSERNALQEKITKNREALEKEILSFQRDLSTAQNQSLKIFNNKLNSVVGDVAKKDQTDLVILRAGVLYQKEAANLDITQQVLSGLSEKDKK